MNHTHSTRRATKQQSNAIQGHKLQTRKDIRLGESSTRLHRNSLKNREIESRSRSVARGRTSSVTAVVVVVVVQHSSEF